MFLWFGWVLNIHTLFYYLSLSQSIPPPPQCSRYTPVLMSCWLLHFTPHPHSRSQVADSFIAPKLPLHTYHLFYYNPPPYLLTLIGLPPPPNYTYLLTPFLPNVLVLQISGRIQARPFLWSGCLIQSSQNLQHNNNNVFITWKKKPLQ